MRKEQRCGQCSRLLFKMDENALAGSLSIKCPRCRTINILRPQSPSPKRPERDGKKGPIIA
ncbi:Com family DNA-binding transcriptional regulator [Thalassovita sp.]|uniref:Com family DNA-binding transcriptional regulator n=1 Tax=Thalassovita sp. TaxID=1979401 RepID=UPI003A5C7941